MSKLGMSNDRGRKRRRRATSNSSSSSVRSSSILADLPSDPEFTAFRPAPSEWRQQQRQQLLHQGTNRVVANAAGGGSTANTSSYSGSKRNYKNKSNINSSDTANSNISSSNCSSDLSYLSLEYSSCVPSSLDVLSMVPATLPVHGTEEVAAEEEDDQVGGNACLPSKSGRREHSPQPASMKHRLFDSGDSMDPIGSFTEQELEEDQINGMYSSPPQDAAATDRRHVHGASTSSPVLLRTPSKRFVVPSMALSSPNSRRRNDPEASAPTTPSKRVRPASDMAKRFTVMSKSPASSPGKPPSTPNTPTRLRPASTIGHALHAPTLESAPMTPAYQNKEQMDRPPRPILSSLLEIARTEKSIVPASASPPSRHLHGHSHHSPTAYRLGHEASRHSSDSASRSTGSHRRHDSLISVLRDQEPLVELDSLQIPSLTTYVVATPEMPCAPEDVASESCGFANIKDKESDNGETCKTNQEMLQTRIQIKQEPSMELSAYEESIVLQTQPIVTSLSSGLLARPVVKEREPEHRKEKGEAQTRSESRLQTHLVTQGETECYKLEGESTTNSNIHPSTSLSLRGGDFQSMLSCPIPSAVLKYASYVSSLDSCTKDRPPLKGKKWHLFVLVVHIDPVSHVETLKGSNAGQKTAKATVTVCDSSSKSFKIVFWRDKTLWLEEIQEGDAILLTDISLSEHNQTISGNTTSTSSICKLDGFALESYSGDESIEEKLRALATKRRQLGLHVLKDIHEPSFYTSMVPLSLAEALVSDDRCQVSSNNDKNEGTTDFDNGTFIGETSVLAVPPNLQSTLKGGVGPPKSVCASSTEVSPVPRQRPAPSSASHNLQDQPALDSQPQKLSSPRLNSSYAARTTARHVSNTFLLAHSKAVNTRKGTTEQSSSPLATGSKVRGRVLYTMLQKPEDPASGWYIGIIVSEGWQLRVETECQDWIESIRVGAVIEFYGRYAKSDISKETYFVVDFSSRPPLVLASSDEGGNGEDGLERSHTDRTNSFGSRQARPAPISFSSIQSLRAARFSGEAVIECYIHAIEFLNQPTSQRKKNAPQENGDFYDESNNGFIRCICTRCQTPATKNPTNPNIFFCVQCRDTETAKDRQQQSMSTCRGEEGDRGKEPLVFDGSLQWSYPPFHVVISDQPRRSSAVQKPRELLQQYQSSYRSRSNSDSDDVDDQKRGHQPSSPVIADSSKTALINTNANQSSTLRVFCSYGCGDELFVSVPACRWVHECLQRKQQGQEHRQRQRERAYDRWERLMRLLTAPPSINPILWQQEDKEEDHNTGGEREETNSCASPIIASKAKEKIKKQANSNHHKIRFHIKVLHSSSLSASPLVETPTAHCPYLDTNPVAAKAIHIQPFFT
ncbi:Shieldin complex subunit 2 [Actinomortierella wolfii]|nr:Shieldin complex subunit 2 [Actinomortierella wolfii]